MKLEFTPEDFGYVEGKIPYKYNPFFNAEYCAARANAKVRNYEDQLEVENTKLREALQKMKDLYVAGIDGLEYAVMCNELANAALEGK